MEPISPTPYPDVNEILDLLHSDVTAILQEQYIGMYLFGSLANGDFDDHSDIDVLFVTENMISGESLNALYIMHERISAMHSPWAEQLEVSYIPRNALHHYNPANNSHPHLDRGAGEKLHTMQHDADWIVQRYILHKRGITVTGPAPQTLIAPVSQADLRWAVSEIVHKWFRHFLDDPNQLKSRGYQSYTVLTLCRILYTYEHGDVLSKAAAAEWAKRSINKVWVPLIDRALLGRQMPGLEALPDDLRGTLDFIRYTMEHIQPNDTRQTEHQPYTDTKKDKETVHSLSPTVLQTIRK